LFGEDKADKDTRSIKNSFVFRGCEVSREVAEDDRGGEGAEWGEGFGALGSLLKDLIFITIHENVLIAI
jgi:hypothetical protein